MLYPIALVGVQSSREKLRPVTWTNPVDDAGLLLGTIAERYAVTSYVKARVFVDTTASAKRAKLTLSDWMPGTVEQSSDVVDNHAVVKHRFASSSIVGELSREPKLYPTKVIDAPPHAGTL
jgi:hypothetical protein